MRLNEEQQMLQDYAQRLLAEQGPIEHLRALRNERNELGYDKPLWQAMHEAGWCGLLAPEEHGGLDFGHLGAGLIAFEIGRHLSVSPFLSTTVMATQAISQGGTKAQQAHWLSKIVAGDTLFALAIDEEHKHQPDSIEATVTENDGQLILNGQKNLVLDGHVADVFLVAAKREQRLELFLVERNTHGIEVERTIMVDSRNSARVNFNNVTVQALDNGHAAYEAALLSGRAVLAAELAGVAQSAFEQTLEYLNERKQFNVHIGSFQALQHRAAHLYAETAMAKALAMRALQAIDSKEEDTAALVFASKAKANQVARLAVSEAVQMHGGIGMTDEFNIGFYMKRARAAIETLGDTSYCSRQFAAAKGY